MGNGCLILIGLIIAVALAAIGVYLFIRFVLPVMLFVVIAIGIIGAIYGAAIGLYNAVQLLIEAHKNIS